MGAKKHAGGPPPAKVDQLSDDEIQKRLEESLVLVQQLRAKWPGLAALVNKDRKANTVGRALTRMSMPLRTLFALVVAHTPLATLFNALGDKDDGYDPTRFEADLLLRRLNRIDAERKLLVELQGFARDLGDDILATGESLVTTGKLAINLAKTLSEGNAEYYAAFKPLINALDAMTEPARKAQAEKRSTKAATPAAPESPAPTNGAATSAPDATK